MGPNAEVSTGPWEGDFHLVLAFRSAAVVARLCRIEF